MVISSGEKKRVYDVLVRHREDVAAQRRALNVLDALAAAALADLLEPAGALLGRVDLQAPQQRQLQRLVAEVHVAVDELEAALSISAWACRGKDAS